MYKLSSVGLLASTLFIGACVADGGGDPSDPGGDFEGIEEGTENLTDLSAQCTFVSGTGVLTLALSDNDVALVSRAVAAPGAITVNGYACGGATATSLKKLVVTGSTGANTLILDYMNGAFAKGQTSAVGFDIDLGAGADAVKFRGSKSADAFVFGSTGLCTDSDNLKDGTVANVESFVVSLSDGNDTFSAAGNATTGNAAFATAVTVYGGGGNDTLRGGSGNDTLNGGDGNDTFTTGTGADGDDVLVGGAGTDTADYSTRTVALTLSINGTADDGASGEADDIQADIEAVKGGTLADTITGSANADTLSGGPGDDTITGGAGADTLNGDAGDDLFDEGAASNGGDVFNGGAGVDTVDYSARSNAITVIIDTGALDGEAGELDKVMVDVEGVIGGSGADTLTGSASDNVLDGSGGGDTISGGAGNDTLTGGAGNDTVNGDAGDDTFDEGAASSGNDVLNGGAGTDTADYSGRTNDLTVALDGTASSGESGETDTVQTDVENLLGGAGLDTLTGNASDNVIEGGASVDTIAGGAGDDTIDGNAGADDVDCGLGDADILLDGSTGTVTNCEL